MVRIGQRIAILFAVTFVLVLPLPAQEWSAEQKEAWAFEVAYWKALTSGDVEATLSQIHPSYRGWNYPSSAPGTKESARMSFSHYFPVLKSFGHWATPLAIVVQGNVAVVHYVIGFHGTNEKGDHESSEDRWTDTLIKEGGKWMLLGDHGGDPSVFKR